LRSRSKNRQSLLSGFRTSVNQIVLGQHNAPAHPNPPRVVRRDHVPGVSRSCDETTSDGLNVPGPSSAARYTPLKIDLADRTVAIEQLPDKLIPPSKPDTPCSGLTSSKRHPEISSESSAGPSTTE
jgi:hypothetical protein